MESCGLLQTSKPIRRLKFSVTCFRLASGENHDEEQCGADAELGQMLKVAGLYPLIVNARPVRGIQIVTAELCSRSQLPRSAKRTLGDRRFRCPFRRELALWWFLGYSLGILCPTTVLR